MCRTGEMHLPSLKLGERTRCEWIHLAEECLYGTAPDLCDVQTSCVKNAELWDGRGRMEEVRIAYGPGFLRAFTARVFTPGDGMRHPGIVWCTFAGDPGPNCPLEEIVADRGYVVACFDREELMEDRPDGRTPLQDAFPGYSWGAVRVWAYGMSMMATSLSSREDVDPDQLVCTGFSRCGKAALAAGILDERFAVTVPVCSGAGGGGCFRYLGSKEGFSQDPSKVESLGRVGSVFPYWWTQAYAAWWPEENPAGMGREADFPLDAHILKALIAPRNLLTLDGLEDTWSNPRGSALTGAAAKPAFAQLGGRMEAFYHAGGHAFGPEDWQTLLDFCDEVFGRTPDGLPRRDWRCVYLEQVARENPVVFD